MKTIYREIRGWLCLQYGEHAVGMEAEEAKAHRWIVVGDPVATADDVAYLAHLRNEFGLPLYYARFDWTTSSLCPVV